MSIPRRLIQTGKQRQLSPLEKSAVTSLKLLHPDWEYLYFDDADVARFIASEFPSYRSVFESFRYPIQRYDFFRYLAVFRLGGFYFDLDVFLSRSVAELLEYDCVFPFEELTGNRFLRKQYGMDWELGNYAFGAGPGNPFLEAVIEDCLRAQSEPAWLRPMMSGAHRMLWSEYYVLNTTGPGLLSRTYAEHAALSDNVRILFPDDVREPANWHLFGDYGIHLMKGSWREEKSHIWRRLASRWEALWTASLMSESISSGPRRDRNLTARSLA